MAFIINSIVNPFVAKRAALNQLQIKITKKEYSFLSHDSFIACNELNTNFTIEEIKNQLYKDSSLIKGNLTSGTKKEIVDQINKSILYSKVQKDLIAGNFSS